MSLKIVSIEDVWGKIFVIFGHDDLCIAAYGRGENIAIVWVGQRETLDEVFIPCDEAIVHGLAHEFPGSLSIL
ncbi:hypothetical protein H7347_04455 [Corynebacterium sp. zg-331]|uniref:hypothetical protein n=1 Tax=unclassified Corynebacterium TaxID=2624378 RepID=UPI00164338B2|nr:MULTISPECIES: hypothetical protein [unclassified Corynebacterium]MBC3185830.1 hypothetical protein [Corynebacterium sp. zg-331]